MSLQQAELQEDVEARGERIGGVQTHKRMVASFEKQIAVQEKKLEQVSCLFKIVHYILHFELKVWLVIVKLCLAYQFLVFYSGTRKAQ